MTDNQKNQNPTNRSGNEGNKMDTEKGKGTGSGNESSNTETQTDEKERKTQTPEAHPAGQKETQGNQEKNQNSQQRK